MKTRDFILSVTLLASISITATAQETASIGLPDYSGPASQNMKKVTGIMAAYPPVPFYYSDKTHTQVVYWSDVKSLDGDAEPATVVSYTLQQAIKQSPRAYTKVWAKGELFDVRYKREISDEGADIGMLRNAQHPMRGQVYELVEAARFDKLAEGWPSLYWLFSDDYLSVRKPLELNIIPADADNRRSLPEQVIKQMEKKYGGKADRSRLTCLIGEDYGAGHIQFKPQGGKCTAVEVVFSGDKVWSFTDIADQVDDISMWHVDDGGEYFGVQPDVVFDGPDGLEIFYFEYAPESSSFGFLTLGDAGRLVKHDIDGYYNYPE
ncbi:MAG: hypothetical protein IJ527_10135 [Prevotella sp.]|nr:hypothetical protein [Prevotella sp.]